MTGIISFCAPYRFSNICSRGRCYRFADKMTVHEYRGKKRGMRDRSARPTLVLLKKPLLTSCMLLLEHGDTFSFERQCAASGKGGQRRSLSRRVLPWHHETSTLLLNLSPAFSLASRPSCARCCSRTHSRGQLQFLASNLLESLVKNAARGRFHSRCLSRYYYSPAPYLLDRHAFSRLFFPASIHARSPRIFLLRQIHFVIVRAYTQGSRAYRDISTRLFHSLQIRVFTVGADYTE